MFYCNDCAKKNGYPESLCKSIGLCEICGGHKVCNDRTSSSLPMPTLKGELGLDMNPVAVPKERKFTINELIKFIDDAEKNGIKPANGEKFTLEEVQESFRKAEKANNIISIKKTPEHPYPVIDVPASGQPEWMGGARTLAFVYSKKGNFILRGYYSEVQNYLKKNYTHYFVNYTLWCKHEHRDIWDFWKDTVGIFQPTNKRRNWKYTVRPYSNSYLNDYDMSAKEIVDMKVENEKKTLKFKRLPKRWIPEFDQL